MRCYFLWRNVRRNTYRVNIFVFPFRHIMPEPLKEMFNRSAIQAISELVQVAYPVFDATSFRRMATTGLADLELLPRAKHIAAALHRHLPSDVPSALDIIVRALPKPPDVAENQEFSSFIYMPFTIYVAEHGLPHFNEAMRANYELTQRFTAEFSIRPYLMHHQERTLETLHQWATDPSHHVRRLVSEGTRPRLPWATRLPAFQKNPKPVLALLEKLKDDPSLYVRRSVANNLNDIGKDNPDALFSTAKKWLKGASTNREWVVKHALRSSIKRGEQGAFAVLGYDKPPSVKINNSNIDPATPRIGGNVCVTFTVKNTSKLTEDLLIDLSVHFVKSNGTTNAKVFKLTTAQLAPGEHIDLRKTISLKQHTTRTHYPGVHRVEVVVNGRAFECGEFTLSAQG